MNADDDWDAEILAGIRDLYAAADPVPAGLVERVQFACELAGPDVEVLRLCARADMVTAIRGDEGRTVTFENDAVSIMVRIGAGTRDRVRIDGWLAPLIGRAVELRRDGGHAVVTDVDDQGRFVFDEVSRGLVQFAVHATPPDGRLVVTPSIVV